MTFGLVITTHNEGRKPEYLEQALEIAQDPRIDEVVISDDGSEDQAETVTRLDIFGKKFPEIGKKLNLQLHKTNLGVFGNKLSGIRAAKSDWIQSLDSDNQISKQYLDVLFRLMAISDKDRVICPSFAMPAFDYREQSGKFVNLQNFNSYVEWKPFGCLLNTGNQCFHRETMLFVMKGIPVQRYDRIVPDYFAGVEIEDLEHRKIYDSADSFCFNKLWILAGKELFVGPGLEYAHKIHCLSSWKSAPKLKDALPVMYMRELVDAADHSQRSYKFVQIVKIHRRQLMEVVVDNGETIYLDSNTGKTVIYRKPKHGFHRRRRM